MFPLKTHIRQQWRILGELASGGAVSQRALACRLGIALGLTNQLVRSLIGDGFVRATETAPGRRTYEITRAGLLFHKRISRAHLDEVVRAHAAARDRIQDRLRRLARTWKPENADRRVAFYDEGFGAAEIGWVCLQAAGLRLVGIVSGAAGRPVCGCDPCGWEQLRGRELAGQRFDRLVILSFRPHGPIRAHLRRCGVPRGVPFWI